MKDYCILPKPLLRTAIEVTKVSYPLCLTYVCMHACGLMGGPSRTYPYEWVDGWVDGWGQIH